MPNDPQLTTAVVTLLTTYLLHSTLLLAAVWLGLAIGRIRSAALHEQLWKLAALAPLATAPLQLAGADQWGGWSIWTLPPIQLAADSQTSEPPAASPNPRSPAGIVFEVNDLAADQFPDDAALVEIVPGPSSSHPDVYLDLPSIEPASDATAPALPEIAIEPAVQPELAIVAAPLPFTATEPPPSNIQEPASGPALSGTTTIHGGVSRGESHPPHDIWRRWLAAVGGVIVALGLLRLACRTAIAQRRLRRSQSVTDGKTRDALDRLLQERGVRRTVRLLQSPSASEPAAGGVLRWTIVVPPGIEQRLTPGELHALFAHEVAHLVRRDPLWLWIGMGLCGCLPFQFLNFLAVRRWRQAAEELCDDWAVAGGVRPLTLANCLTRVAEWRLSPMPVGLTAEAGKSPLARRIGRLLNGESHTDRWSRPARRRLLFAGAAGCVAILTVFGPRMQAGTTRAEPPRVAGAGLSGAQEAPVNSDTTPRNRVEHRGLPTEIDSDADVPEHEAATAGASERIDADIGSLITDLERVEHLIGELGDDPEIDAVRARLRTRLDTLRTRVANGDQM